MASSAPPFNALLAEHFECWPKTMRWTFGGGSHVAFRDVVLLKASIGFSSVAGCGITRWGFSCIRRDPW